jgi:hypothetical protein
MEEVVESSLVPPSAALSFETVRPAVVDARGIGSSEDEIRRKKGGRIIPPTLSSFVSFGDASTEIDTDEDDDENEEEEEEKSEKEEEEEEDDDFGFRIWANWQAYRISPRLVTIPSFVSEAPRCRHRDEPIRNSVGTHGKKKRPRIVDVDAVVDDDPGEGLKTNPQKRRRENIEREPSKPEIA